MSDHNPYRRKPQGKLVAPMIGESGDWGYPDDLPRIQSTSRLPLDESPLSPAPAANYMDCDPHGSVRNQSNSHMKKTMRDRQEVEAAQWLKGGLNDRDTKMSTDQKYNNRRKDPNPFADMSNSAASVAEKPPRGRFPVRPGGMEKTNNGNFEEIALQDFGEASSERARGKSAKSTGRERESSVRPTGQRQEKSAMPISRIRESSAKPAGLALHSRPQVADRPSNSPEAHSTPSYESEEINQDVSTRKAIKAADKNSLRTDVKMGMATESSPYVPRNMAPSPEPALPGPFSRGQSPRARAELGVSKSSRAGTHSGAASGRDGSTIDTVDNIYRAYDDRSDTKSAESTRTGVPAMNFREVSRECREFDRNSHRNDGGASSSSGRNPRRDINVGPTKVRDGPELDLNYEFPPKSKTMDNDKFFASLPSSNYQGNHTRITHTEGQPLAIEVRIVNGPKFPGESKSQASASNPKTASALSSRTDPANSRLEGASNMGPFNLDIGPPPDAPAREPYRGSEPPEIMQLHQQILREMRRASNHSYHGGFPSSGDLSEAGDFDVPPPLPLNRENLAAVAKSLKLPVPQALGTSTATSTTQDSDIMNYNPDAVDVAARSDAEGRALGRAVNTVASMATTGEGEGDGQDGGDWETVADTATVGGLSNGRVWTGLNAKRTGDSIADVSDNEYGSDLPDFENVGPSVAYHPPRGAAYHGHTGVYRQRPQQNNGPPVLLPTFQGHKVNGYLADSNRLQPTQNGYQTSPPLKADHKNPFESSPPVDMSPFRFRSKATNMFPRLAKKLSSTTTTTEDVNNSGVATLGSSYNNLERPSSYAHVLDEANKMPNEYHNYDGTGNGRVIEHHHNRAQTPSMGSMSLGSESSDYVNDDTSDAILGSGMMHSHGPSSRSRAYSGGKSKATQGARGPFFHQSTGRHGRSKLQFGHTIGEEREMDDLNALPTQSDLSITSSGNDPHFRPVQLPSNGGFAYNDPRAPVRNPIWREMYTEEELARIDRGEAVDGRPLPAEHRVGVAPLSREIILYAAPTLRSRPRYPAYTGLSKHKQEDLSKRVFIGCFFVPILGQLGVMHIAFACGYLDWYVSRETHGDIRFANLQWKRRACITGAALAISVVCLIITLALLAWKRII